MRDLLTIDKSAQENIISPLLDYLGSNNTPLQRVLALYPHVAQSDRSKWILKFLDKLVEALKAGKDDRSKLEGIIEPYSKSFKKFDSILTAIGNRDHFVHQFEVFSIGVNLILLLGNKGCEPFSDVNTNTYLSFWLLCSLSHDIGYCIQDSGKALTEIANCFTELELLDVAKPLNEFVSRFVLNASSFFEISPDVSKEEPFRDCILEGLNATLGDAKISREVLNSSVLDGTHGFYSAFILFNSLQKTEILEICTYKRHICLVLASLILHDTKFTFGLNRLEYDVNPYAYLLYFADTIQDWSRGLGKDEDRHSECILKEYVQLDDIQYNCYLDFSRCSEPDYEGTTAFIESKKSILRSLSRDRFKCSVAINYFFGRYVDDVDSLSVQLDL